MWVHWSSQSKCYYRRVCINLLTVFGSIDGLQVLIHAWLTRLLYRLLLCKGHVAASSLQHLDMCTSGGMSMVNNKQTKDIQVDENLIDELTWFEWIYWFCAYIIASIAPHKSFPVKNVYWVMLRRTSLNVVVKKVEGVVRWPSGGITHRWREAVDVEESVDEAVQAKLGIVLRAVHNGLLSMRVHAREDDDYSLHLRFSLLCRSTCFAPKRQMAFCSALTRIEAFFFFFFIVAFDRVGWCWLLTHFPVRTGTIIPSFACSSHLALIYIIKQMFLK